MLAMPSAVQRDRMRRFLERAAEGEAGFIAGGSQRMGGAGNDRAGRTRWGIGAALGAQCQAAAWISALALRGRFGREARHFGSPARWPHCIGSNFRVGFAERQAYPHLSAMWRVVDPCLMRTGNRTRQKSVAVIRLLRRGNITNSFRSW